MLFRSDDVQPRMLQKRLEVRVDGPAAHDLRDALPMLGIGSMHRHQPRMAQILDRSRMKMGNHPVHAAPEVGGWTIKLKGRLLHHGEKDLHSRLDRINRYTTATVPVKILEKSRFVRLKMLFYPCLAFLKEYLMRRHILNGWAGFIAARAAAIHAFVKYAKVYEAKRTKNQ